MRMSLGGLAGKIKFYFCSTFCVTLQYSQWKWLQLICFNASLSGSSLYHTTSVRLPQHMEGAISPAAGSPEVNLANKQQGYINVHCLPPNKIYMYCMYLDLYYLTMFLEIKSHVWHHDWKPRIWWYNIKQQHRNVFTVYTFYLCYFQDVIAYWTWTPVILT